MTSPVLELSQVSKSFTMHLQSGTQLQVLKNVDLVVQAGECVVLQGASGSGKSSLLKMVYGNYGCESGRVLLTPGQGHATIDLASCADRELLHARTHLMSYVSQFLRVVPRVSSLELVANEMIRRGEEAGAAMQRARDLLQFLNMPPALWPLPPASFSGGEQQRINIAMGMVTSVPLMLLDEPTASLDSENRARVVELVREKKAAGVAMLGIFHDAEVRDAVADRVIEVSDFIPKAVAVSA